MKKLISIIFLLVLLSSCFKNDLSNNKVLNLGIPLKELIKKGVPVEKLYAAGASLKDLVDAGAPLSELLKLNGISLTRIISCWPPQDKVIELARNGTVSIEDLVNAGFGVGPLLRAGYSSQLESTGITGFMFDSNGKKYRWVIIGNQTWMAEDLKTQNYSDGRLIPELSSSTHLEFWQNYVKGYYYRDSYYDLRATPYYLNDAGFYYNWAAASDGLINNPDTAIVTGVCPEGWHLPNYQEFDTLMNYVQLNWKPDSIGSALRSVYGWSSYSGNGSDYYGFNALPKGYFYSEIWGQIGDEAIYWTSNNDIGSSPENILYHAIFLKITPYYLALSGSEKVEGRCVRCLKNKK